MVGRFGNSILSRQWFVTDLVELQVVAAEPNTSIDTPQTL